MSGQLLKSIRQVFAYAVEGKRFDSVLRKVTITEASPGRVLAEVTIDEEHLNGQGGLHGGFTATLIDNMTTMALLTNDGGVTGVSVDLTVSYLKGAKAGDLVIIDSMTDKFGKTLAYLSAEVRNKETNSILAKALHTKYVGDR